uniref:hypothetical protein n=1 Tax=Pseudomonas oryzihabitans TaxID=47885 RepID=UPI002B1D7714
VPAFFVLCTGVPDQAVLTDSDRWPKALGYRALRESRGGKKPTELSELMRIDVHFLVFLLRIDFDNMGHFCKNVDGLLL